MRIISAVMPSRDLMGARASPRSASSTGLETHLAAAGWNDMTRLLSICTSALLRSAVVLGVFLVCVALAPSAGAQDRNSGAAVNPTASSVKEQQLLQQMRIISGRGSIPDVKSYNIEQPAGRDWRGFHEITLHWIGGI